MRRLIPILTLLTAAVAGAEPAPPDPADAVERPVELRDQTTGQRLVCSCRYTGDTGADTGATCSSCRILEGDLPPRPSIRVTGQGRYVSAPVWSGVTERVQDDARVRALLADLEIQVDGYNFEFALTCRTKPGDRRHVPTGLTMPKPRDSLVRMIHDAVERECSEPTHETMWAGCPAEDDYDHHGFNEFANPKIRISARPESNPDAWARLHRDLISDELIYHCANELLIDPVGSSRKAPDAPVIFRANVTLVCANDPTKRAEFDNGVGAMEAPVFRRWLRGEIKRVCGLKIATIDGGAARR